jgi:hypothetical protein
MSSTSLDGVFEKYFNDRQYYLYGKNLNESERKILNPRDIWIVSLVQELPFKDLVNIGSCFNFLSFKHYMELQFSWFDQEKYLLATRLDRIPDDLEIIQDSEENKNMERYRLCYVLGYPHKVFFNMKKYPEHRFDVDAFLGISSMNHSIPLNHYVIIKDNTIHSQGYENH